VDSAPRAARVIAANNSTFGSTHRFQNEIPITPSVGDYSPVDEIGTKAATKPSSMFMSTTGRLIDARHAAKQDTPPPGYYNYDDGIAAQGAGKSFPQATRKIEFFDGVPNTPGPGEYNYETDKKGGRHSRALSPPFGATAKRFSSSKKDSK